MSDAVKRKEIQSSFNALVMLKESRLMDTVISCWERIWSESKWDNLTDCPFNPHFPEVSLVNHINCVTDLVMGAADVLEKYNSNLKLDRDYLLTGVLLHDISKMVEIDPGPDGPIFSEFTRQMPHSTYGAFVAMAQGLGPRVANIILSHTKLTGAVPDSPEAVLLHYLDYGMADVLRAAAGLPLIMVAGPTFGKK